MAVVSTLFVAASATMTCTLTSLAAGTARLATAIDNTTTLALDALCSFEFELNAAPAINGFFRFWVYASEDGTNYTDAASAIDSAYTFLNPTNLRILGIHNAPNVVGLVYQTHAYSVAKTCGGVMPRRWGVVVENVTSVPLTAVAGDHVCRFTDIKATVV